MPDLIPFAVIHIGVSVALAAMLILMHRRLDRADFLLYWAMFRLAIAANPAVRSNPWKCSGGGRPGDVRRFAADVLTGRGLSGGGGVQWGGGAKRRRGCLAGYLVLVTDVVMPLMSRPEFGGATGGTSSRSADVVCLRVFLRSGLGPDQLSPTRAYLQSPYIPEQLCQHVASLAET